MNKSAFNLSFKIFLLFLPQISLILLLNSNSILANTKYDNINDSKIENGQFFVKVTGGKISVKAEKAELKSILNELEKKSDVTIEIGPNVNEEISISFNDLPFEKAVIRLAKNWTMVFQKDPLTKGITVAKIGIYSASEINETTNNNQKSLKGLSDKSRLPKKRYGLIRDAWQEYNQDVGRQLRGILNDPSEIRQLRITAARSLAKAGNIVFVDDVKDIIERTDDKNLIFGLTSALGGLKHERSIELLSDLALNGKYDTLRYKSVQSLSKIGDHQAIATLKTSAKTDPDKFTRAKAIIGIASIDKEKALPFIQEIKQTEKDDFVLHVCNQILTNNNF